MMAHIMSIYYRESNGCAIGSDAGFTVNTLYKVCGGLNIKAADAAALCSILTSLIRLCICLLIPYDYWRPHNLGVFIHSYRQLSTLSQLIHERK